MATDDDDDIRRAKDQLRDSVVRMSRQLDTDLQAAASQRVSERLLTLGSVRRAHTAALYRATGHELDPASALAAMERRGIRTLLPRLVDDRIHLAPSGDPGLLVAGHHGIPEPASGSVPVEEVDVIILPGVAFDLDGGRLGRGGGHYDRLLALMPNDTVRIGVAHTGQMVTRVPREDHDELLDVLVTDRGVHHTGARNHLRDA